MTWKHITSDQLLAWSLAEAVYHQSSPMLKIEYKVTTQGIAVKQQKYYTSDLITFNRKVHQEKEVYSL